MSWYGVRCIFKWRDRPEYEERIIVWREKSIEAAIERAEAEAREYGADTELEYLELAQAFDLKADQIKDGSEVFSLIRTSPLAPGEYIDRFFDTGSERQRRLKG